MILPSKHIATHRSLLGLGKVILELLERPRTVSALWEKLRDVFPEKYSGTQVTFTQFVLGLDFLYSLGAVQLDKGLVHRGRLL